MTMSAGPVLAAKLKEGTHARHASNMRNDAMTDAAPETPDEDQPDATLARRHLRTLEQAPVRRTRDHARTTTATGLINQPPAGLPTPGPTPRGTGRAPAPLGAHFGITTLSMTWMTPLSAAMSVAVTLALSTITPPMVVMVSSLPWTVLTLPGLTSAAMTLPGTTW